MKKVIFFFFLSLCQLVIGQDKGTVKGKVTDKEMSGDVLPFANIYVKGTSIGSTTDMDGNYTISVPVGQQTIVFSFIGYQTIEETINVVAGKTTVLNKEMGASEGVALDEIEITTTVNKEKESALLLEQKKATVIQTKIGAQELSKKGVSDVATAVTKTTGISKQEGSGGVFVRGLGDRYNVTMLNGLPLPSNDPSKKNINLDIFSTDIVQYVGIDKTYSPQNYGDFGGANIDISSKVYTGTGFVELGLGMGANSAAVSQSDFYLTDGPNYSGFYSNNYPDFPLNNYNFETSWDRVKSNPPINGSYSIKGGDVFNIGENAKINFFSVASFDNGYKYKEGIARGNVATNGLIRRDYDYKGYSYETNTTLMGGLRFKYKDHTFNYNGLYVNTTTQKQEEYEGIVDVFDYAPEGGAFVQRQTFDRTQLIVHQLLGDHRLNDKFDISWGGSYNFVLNNVPNRRQVILSPDDWDEPEGPKSFRNANNQSDNHRYYHNLQEEELAARVATSYKFAKNEDDEYKGKLILGYNGRFKNAYFEATQFNFAIRDRGNQPIVEDQYDLDSYFNQENFNNGLFEIVTFRGGLGSGIDVLLPQTYYAEQYINAGFMSLEYMFSEAFSGVFGVRLEQVNQNVYWDTSLSNGENELSFLEYLPSVSLKYVLNDQQNLKFAASKTYTLPQYKERAPFQYEDVANTTFGNAALYQSTNYNIDFKWDYFPKSSEIISAGVFGKYIQNPINEIVINSASNDVSWVNSGDKATVIGAEIELRKNIFEDEIESGDNYLKSDLTAGFNFSYMYSNQELDGDKVLRETTERGFPLSVDFSFDESSLTGASDVLVNADVSYFREFTNKRSIRTTLAYNYFSDRLYSLATEGRGNLVQSGVSTLDFILKSKVNEKIGLNLSVKNILNPTYKTTQEKQDVIVSSYKKGLDVSFSLTYNF